ncbi:MAG: phage major capsid protein [Clostridia bacterium]|nr:phage major capsid protein [Clostridia bacterium]
MSKYATYGVFSEDYKNNFWNYMRTKDYNPENLSYGITAAGTYAIPLGSNAPFKSALKEHSAFRGIANVYALKGSGNYLVAQDSTDWADWIGENEGIPVNDAAADFTEHPLGNYKIGVFCKFPDSFVLDAKFDIETHISRRLAKNFAKAENRAFTIGDGGKMPTGILADNGGADIGVTTKTLTYDDVIKLYFSVKSEYRKNGVWMMSDETVLALRTLKDANGNYVWDHSTGTIFGKKIVINEYMPTIAVGNKPIAFGDFSYYDIVERADASVRIIKETLPKVDDIGYIAYEFLDGKLIRPEAIKVLQMV